MVNIYIPDQVDEPGLRENYFDYTTSGTLDVLAKTFDETLYYNPISSLGRMNEYYWAKDSGKKLTQEEWSNSEFYREGIEVGEDGIYTGAASLLAERFDDRKSRQIVLNRSKGGFALGAAQFGVGIVGSMLDPINIAASFVPVVRAGQFAKLSQTYGKTGARILTGAAEGAVGGLIVEPLALTAATIEQDKDYTLYDSFLNVTIGAALGTGLHVIGGKWSDLLEQTRPDTREVLTRTSVAQLMDDRRVDVEPVAQADRTLRTAGSKPQQIKPDTVGQPIQGKGKSLQEVQGVNLPKQLKPLQDKPKSLIDFIKERGGINSADERIAEIAVLIDNTDPSLVVKGGKSLDELAAEAQDAGYLDVPGDSFTNKATAKNLTDAIKADAASNKRVFSKLDKNAVKFSEAEALYEEALSYGIDPKGMSAKQFDDALNAARQDARRKQNAARTPEDDFASLVERDGLTEEEFYRFRERNYEAMNESAVTDEYKGRAGEMERDVAAFDESDELSVLTRENQDLQADLDRLEAEGLVPQDLADDIRAADDLINKADNSYDAATRAGADCVLRSL